MAVSHNRSIVIVGVGPLMSKALAIWLATLGWDIALISRSEPGLAAIAKEVTEAHTRSDAQVIYRPADAGDTASLTAALDWCALQFGGKIDVLSYNAARMVPADITTVTPADLEQDFRVSAVGTLVAGQWFTQNASRERVAQGEYPLFLVTGGVLDRFPEPMFATLSAVKASSQTISRLFAKVLPEQANILVGMPLVKARVVEPEDEAYDPHYAPDAIVQKLFRPFFEDREAGQKSQWIVERVL